MQRLFIILVTLALTAACAPQASQSQRAQQPIPDLPVPETIVLANSTPDTLSKEASFVPKEHKVMLELLNAARAEARLCGEVWFESAAPLSFNAVLFEPAVLHAQDMNMHKYFSHTGADGSDVAKRVSRTGYTWAKVAENLAYGTVNAYTEADIVKGWLNSPGHCQNIMNPAFTEIGLSKYTDNYDFWVHVFAVPQALSVSN